MRQKILAYSLPRVGYSNHLRNATEGVLYSSTDWPKKSNRQADWPVGPPSGMRSWTTDYLFMDYRGYLPAKPGTTLSVGELTVLSWFSTLALPAKYVLKSATIRL